MTKLTKFLSLIPIVALGAACNGVSPTASDSVVMPEAGAAYDSSSKAIGPTPGACQNITGVQLTLGPTTDRSTLIVAKYVGLGGSVLRCTAPVWTSDPRGALILNINPYKTRVNQSYKSVIVTATAPNGVQGRIQITNGGVQSEAIGCKNITGVELKRVLTPQRATVIRASYVAFGGQIDTRCAAPLWTSNPKGALLPDSNPYKTRVSQAYRSVVVFATAPNGAQGSITVNP